MPEFTADRDDLRRAVRDDPDRVLRWIENNHDQDTLDLLQSQVDPPVVEADVPPALRAAVLSAALEKLKRAGYADTSEYDYFRAERDQARDEAVEEEE